MRRDRFLGTTEGLNDGKHWRRMGMARPLFDFLVSKQTNPDGRVNFGQPITYRWMRERILTPPPERTLRRYLEILRRHGYVEVERINYQRTICRGFTVRINKPKKWSQQMGLFAVEKPVEKLRKAGGEYRPDVAGSTGQMWPDKVFRRKDSEKFKTPAPTPRAVTTPDEHRKKIENRNQRLVRELEIAKEITCGEPPRIPKSFRNLHPDVLAAVARLAKRRAM